MRKEKNVRTFKQIYYAPIELTVHLSDDEEEEIVKLIGEVYDGDPFVLDNVIEDTLCDKFYDEKKKFEKQNECILHNGDDTWYEVRYTVQNKGGDVIC